MVKLSITSELHIREGYVIYDDSNRNGYTKMGDILYYECPNGKKVYGFYGTRYGMIMVFGSVADAEKFMEYLKAENPNNIKVDLKRIKDYKIISLADYIALYFSRKGEMPKNFPSDYIISQRNKIN